MADLPIPGDTTDPCADYLRLKKVYERVATGETVKRVRFHNGEEQRETEFSQANIGVLEKLMNDAKDACQLSLGNTRPRRSAIGIGRMGPQVRRIY